MSTAQNNITEKGNEVENQIKADGKYAILVRQGKHFKASVMTAMEMTAKHSEIQFEIVLLGESVKELATDPELLPFVNQCQTAGVKIIICGFAMKQLEVEPSELPNYVEITPNGFTFIFGLQEMGFKTITL